MEIEKVNLTAKLNTFSDYWSPKIVGELNNQIVKVAKFKGEFVMHHHEQEDELFYVIAGELFIELMDKTLHLSAGEFVVIPKGVAHKPYAPEEVHVMLYRPPNYPDKITELNCNFDHGKETQIESRREAGHYFGSRNEWTSGYFT